jgi:hypothetical protein
MRGRKRVIKGRLSWCWNVGVGEMEKMRGFVGCAESVFSPRFGGHRN